MFYLIAPFPPTGFAINREYHGILQTTLTLVWDPPVGRGPHAVVDNYAISISPASPHHPERIQVFTTQVNVTLDHNEVYNVSLIAANCFGESLPTILPDIGIGVLILLSASL